MPTARTSSDKLGMLTEVTDVTSDNRGVIILLDGHLSRIVATDHQLKPLAYFGRRGSGPGEFREAVSIRMLSRARFAVLDRALRRVTIVVVKDGGRSLVLQRTIPLGVASEAMCILPSDDILIYGYGAGKRLHLFGMDSGQLLRSFGPSDSTSSPMARDLVATGSISCDASRDQVLVASRFLPVTEVFQITTGQRVWVDTLPFFRPLRVEDEGTSVSLVSGRSGYSRVSGVFGVAGYRIFQTRYDARQDRATIDTIVTHVYAIRERAWMPPNFHVPLIFRLADTLALSVDDDERMELTIQINRVTLASGAGARVLPRKHETPLRKPD